MKCTDVVGFKKCTCGKYPSAFYRDSKYYVECDCGRFIPALRSKEDCVKWWNNFIDTYVPFEDEK